MPCCMVATPDQKCQKSPFHKFPIQQKFPVNPVCEGQLVPMQLLHIYL